MGPMPTKPRAHAHELLGLAQPGGKSGKWALPTKNRAHAHEKTGLCPRLPLRFIITLEERFRVQGSGFLVPRLGQGSEIELAEAEVSRTEALTSGLGFRV